MVRHRLPRRSTASGKAASWLSTGSTTIEKWKLDIRWTYVFEHNTGPYLAVQDDFGNLVEVHPDFKILEV